MERKPWMVEVAKDCGRKYLNDLTIGIIREIVKESNTPTAVKLAEIERTLKDLDEIYHDKSFSYDVTDVKKAPALTEAVKKINHLDCTVNVTKVQSLLEPWYLEQILRDGGGMK